MVSDTSAASVLAAGMAIVLAMAVINSVEETGREKPEGKGLGEFTLKDGDWKVR